MLLLDPDVHQALRDFTAAPQRTHEHTTALRLAVAHADRDQLAHQPVPHRRLAQLAAAITRPDGTPVPRPTLRFLLERAR